MQKVLIIGKNSYIGTSLETCLTKYPQNYAITTLDTLDKEWENASFVGYDSLLHVAGIAHVSKNPKLEDLYYKVNRDLPIAVAKKAKAAGIKQFIFMSSAIVYGADQKIDDFSLITATTKPNPANFYGKSKLEAELALQALEADDFLVCLVRTPMVYGPGCKGNFPKLIQYAKKLPVFPNIQNQRSMIYIDNLCEFLKQTMDAGRAGIVLPQNSEYVSTAQVVLKVAKLVDKKIYLTTAFNGLLRFLSEHITFINKVFGNKAYQHSSEEALYNVVDFQTSLEHTIEGV